MASDGPSKPTPPARRPFSTCSATRPPCCLTEPSGAWRWWLRSLQQQLVPQSLRASLHARPFRCPCVLAVARAAVLTPGLRAPVLAVARAAVLAPILPAPMLAVARAAVPALAGGPSGAHVRSGPCRSPCPGSSGARAGSSPCRSPCTSSSGARAGRGFPCCACLRLRFSVVL
jgi:hypothetical protein